MNTIIWNLNTFWALFRKEMLIFKPDFSRCLVNNIFWTSTLLASFIFLKPQTGLPFEYAVFMLPVMAASLGLFDIIANTISIIADISSNRVIDQDLTLPLFQWLVFVKVALANAYRSFLPSFLVLPWGMLFIYLVKGIVFTRIHIVKTVLILVMANIFFGFLSLFAASFMTHVAQVRNIWMRVIFPMWWLGGFMYHFQTVQENTPLLALLMRLSPMMYVSEGVRAAMLGQEGFLNYWLCMGVIVVCTLIVGTIAVKRFLKRLDCL